MSFTNLLTLLNEKIVNDLQCDEKFNELVYSSLSLFYNNRIIVIFLLLKSSILL